MCVSVCDLMSGVFPFLEKPNEHMEHLIHNVSLGHELPNRHYQIVPLAINLLSFYVTTNAVENLTELIRLDKDAPLMFSFAPLFFFHKGALVSEGQIAVISDTDNHVALSFPSDPSVPSSVSIYVFLPVSPVITSEGLFLSVSYDVLWPCSGSRTVTVLSLCHLIDTPFLVTCTDTACLSVCVCVHPYMTINQVNNSSPQPCAPAYVSS